MGSDSVAVGECAIIFGNDAAISQQDGAALDRFDLDQFAVDEVPTRRHRVGLEEQFVAGGDSERSGFSCVKRNGALTQFEFAC